MCVCGLSFTFSHILWVSSCSQTGVCEKEKYSGDIWGKSWKTQSLVICFPLWKMGMVTRVSAKIQVTEVIISSIWLHWKLLEVKTCIAIITASKVPLIVHKKYAILYSEQLFKKKIQTRPSHLIVSGRKFSLLTK